MTALDPLEALLSGRLKAADREIERTIKALEAVALSRGDQFAAGQVAESARVALACLSSFRHIADRLGVE